MKRLLFPALLLFCASCAFSPAPSPPPTSTATPFPTLPLATKTPVPTHTTAPTETARPPDTPTVPPNPSPAPPTAEPTLPAVTAVSSDPVLVGAGDIAVCDARGDEATAALLQNIDGTIFTLGDNVYPNGTSSEFSDCFAPSWGKFRARTRPIPGNHDYITENAGGYYAYFGDRAGDPARGYYSYDLGAWHILALNSEIDTRATSVQVRWLRADLAAHPAPCTLAMFHRPLFSSGPHGRDGGAEKTRPLWDALYENHVDVILNGHDHDYERFAPQDPQGAWDDANGIRQFIVGTGGASPYPFGEIRPNSEIHFTGTFGVLKLTLHSGSYDWEFLSITPLLFRDRGTGACH